MVPHASNEGDHRGGPETMLLIGDKVVNAAPSEKVYGYQMDLGEEWKKLTGLPFVFAMWMMRADMVDEELAKLLAEARRRGAAMTDELLDLHAMSKGWPRELARQYFTQFIQYEVTAKAREGLAKFYELAGNLGVLPVKRKVKYLEVE